MKSILFLLTIIVLLFTEMFSQSASFQGISFTGTRPPDPVIAAGPNHIVIAVNSKISFLYQNWGIS